MSRLSIVHPHHASVDQVRQQVEKLMTSLQSKYGASSQWEGDSTVRVKAPSITGSLSFDSTALHIDVQFGMLGNMLKPKIETEIRDYLNKHLT